MLRSLCKTLKRTSRIRKLPSVTASFLPARAYYVSVVMELIPELLKPHVHIANKEAVSEKIKNIHEGGTDKLQVISDFDYTLTKTHKNGTRCATCYGVIESYSRMPPEFSQKTQELFHKYYPIEIDPHMNVEDKIPHMIDWYNKAHDLMLECNLYKKDFMAMVQETPIHFRDGTLDLLNALNDIQVPVLVFSAGIGDVIDEVLIHNNIFKPNVKVISNYMEFDEDQKLIKFSRQLIHMFNKNESAIKNASYFQDLAHRHNVLLLGDSLGDLHMAKGVEPPSTVLKIGFLNDKIEERLQKYKDNFDIVIVDDQTMDIPRAILRAIM